MRFDPDPIPFALRNRDFRLLVVRQNGLKPVMSSDPGGNLLQGQHQQFQQRLRHSIRSPTHQHPLAASSDFPELIPHFLRDRIQLVQGHHHQDRSAGRLGDQFRQACQPLRSTIRVEGSREGNLTKEKQRFTRLRLRPVVHDQ
jgi:hypothetical protein